MQRRKRQNTHTAYFINILRNNDYPTSITWHLNDEKSRKLRRPSNTCFLKLPHFSEIITKEIRRAIYKKGLDIQLAYSGPSLRQYPTKKNNNTVTTCTLANSPIRDPNICQKTYTIYRLICLKCQFLYRKGNISTLKGGPLKLVDMFTYLASSISSTENDINTRRAKAWTATGRLSIIWKSDLTDEIKCSFFQAEVVSILLYRCTT